MRRIVTTAVAIALVGGALGAPAVAADNDRPATPGSFGVLDPSDLLELTPEPALPVLEEQVEPTAPETLATARRVLAEDPRRQGRKPVDRYRVQRFRRRGGRPRLRLQQRPPLGL